MLDDLPELILQNHDREWGWRNPNSLKILVKSAEEMEFTRGSMMVCLYGALLGAFSALLLGISHETTLKPVESRSRFELSLRTQVYGLTWRTVNYGELTSVRLHIVKDRTWLELRAPGIRDQIAGLSWSDSMLEEIETEANRLISKENDVAMELHFRPFVWIGLLLVLAAVAVLIFARVKRVCFDGKKRTIVMRDWNGFVTEKIPFSLVARISVEDGDPKGWHMRCQGSERWLIVAHLQTRGSRCLGVTECLSFASEWAARASLLCNHGRLVGVSSGTYALWDRASPW